MPYVSEETQNELRDRSPKNVGELNYQLTHTILQYLAQQSKLDYATLNGVVGALESCKQEFYRRAVAPYEENKKLDNGDIYMELEERIIEEWEGGK